MAKNTFSTSINEIASNPPSKKEYLINLEKKIEDPDFAGDIYALLRPGIDYNQSSAFDFNDLIFLIPLNQNP